MIIQSVNLEYLHATLSAGCVAAHFAFRRFENSRNVEVPVAESVFERSNGSASLNDLNGVKRLNPSVELRTSYLNGATRLNGAPVQRSLMERLERQ